MKKHLFVPSAKRRNSEIFGAFKHITYTKEREVGQALTPLVLHM